MSAQSFVIPFEFSCGIFVLLLNILGSQSNFTRPKSNYEGIIRSANPKNLLALRNFKYKISPECKASNIVWIVTSYAGDNSKRNALRRAYSSQELLNLGIQRVFLLAELNEISQNESKISQIKIKNEARRFKDIVQGNFFEAYRNLTYKHLMGLKWCIQKCHQVPYIMKSDDDIVLNFYEVLDKLKSININNSIAGYVFGKLKPIRIQPSKWFITKDEFTQDYYPPFVSGWFYATTHSVASKLIDQAKRYPKYFWIDDVFITGILRAETNIKLVDIKEIYANNYRLLECCIEGRKEGLKCEFAIGPSDHNASLHIRFKEFTDFCRYKCKSRPKNLSVRQTC